MYYDNLMAYYVSTIEFLGILVSIKMKCHNNIIPYSGVTTKIFELLSLNKQKHLMKLLMIFLKRGISYGTLFVSPLQVTPSLYYSYLSLNF